MRAGDLLRRLDQRLLPRLAGALARLAEGRARNRALASAAVLSVLAVLLTAIWAADREPTGDPTVGDVVRVGVTDGDSIPGYVRSASQELAALAGASPSPTGETYALVSLSAYLAPDRLPPEFADVTVSEVFARVPIPGRQTQIVRIPARRLPADLLTGMAEVADRKEREAADYRARRAAVTGNSAADRELRRLYDSGAQVAEAEAAAYRAHCSCLYAAVVRAQPARLRQVASRPDVRVVDPAPEVRRLDRAVFSPPLPEQVDVVRPPADRDVGVSAAPVTATPSAAGSATPSRATSSPSPEGGTGTAEPAPTGSPTGPDAESGSGPAAPPAGSGTAEAGT